MLDFCTTIIPAAASVVSRVESRPCPNFWLIHFIFLFFLFPSAWACILQDDAGHTLKLMQPAQRIVSLSPDLTEILLSLGAEKSLVGVIAGSDYPPQAKKIRRVGDYHALDKELIIALHPDLIVAWGESHVQELDFFRHLSIPVYVSHPQHLLDIPHTIKALGCLAGQSQKADQIANQFIQNYHQLSKKYGQIYSGQSRVRVFYEIAAHPLMSINRRSWINEAIELCGGQNLFAQEYFSDLFKQTAFTLSLESVLKANPQVIIAGLPPGWQRQWQAWPNLVAVKSGSLISINPDLIERPGPRILEGVEEMCKHLNPTLSIRSE